MIRLEVLILAVIRGIAQFLPVGSSAHMAVGIAAGNQYGQLVQEKPTANITEIFE